MDWSKLFSTPIGELLRGKEEPVARVSCRPAVGTTLCCAGLRMTVQAGMSDDLWEWLINLGWRELHPRDNRLHFRPLPTASVTRLFDCTKEEREGALLAAIRSAANGSTTRVVVSKRVSTRVA